MRINLSTRVLAVATGQHISPVILARYTHPYVPCLLPQLAYVVSLCGVQRTLFRDC
jgi:hypothetical protein